MSALAFYLFFCWLALVAVSLPWVGVAGYFTYVILGSDASGASWYSFPVSTQKLLAGGTLFGFLLAQFRVQRLTGFGRLSVLSLLVFLSLALLSAQLSLFPIKSWWFIDYFWKICVMFVLGAHLLDRPKRIMWTVWGIILAQGWNALQVNYEYFHMGMSMTSIVGRNSLDNNTYALSTLVPMGLAAAVAVYARNWFPRVVVGIILGLQVHQVLLMQTRGGMLAMIVLFVVGLWFMPKRWDTVVGASLVGAAGLVLAGPMVVQRFNTIFADDKKRDASAESRFELWNAGWRIMCDYPVLGVGVFAGERMVPKYTKFSEDPDKALHNLFFDIGTGTGFSGVGAFLLFFWFSYRTAYWLYRQRETPDWAKIVSLGVLAGIPSYWVGSMFSSSALIESPYIACALAVAASAVFARERLVRLTSSAAGPMKFHHRSVSEEIL